MLARDSADLVRALDRRILLPVLAAYCCSYVDRSNIANSLTSLERSIGLTPRFYALSAALFTFSLVLVEIPSNALLKQHGARLWLTALVAGCGACTVIQGLVGSWQALVGVRTALGLFEGGVFPGALYALTLYYPPEHLILRIAAFTLAASLAFAAGSFGAGVLLPIGNDGWRVLFVLQGLLTLAVAAVLYACLPPPSSTHGRTEPPAFLPDRQRALFVLLHAGADADDQDGSGGSDLPARRSTSTSRRSNRALIADPGLLDGPATATGSHTPPQPNSRPSSRTGGRRVGVPPVIRHPTSIRSGSTTPLKVSSDDDDDEEGSGRAVVKAGSSTPLLLTPLSEYPPPSSFVALASYTDGDAFSRSSSPSPAADVAAAAKASSSSSILSTVLAPATLLLSFAYLLLLLATTPSTFLPRLLQARWALSEPSSNALVGVLYFLGGFLQLLVGFLAGRSKGRGLLGTWRVVAAAVVGLWVGVAVWEGLVGGEGVRAKGEGEWEWVGAELTRWVGVGLRVAATMATPTLGSLYLSLTVSLPKALVPNKAILTACVISIGNLAQALGPSLYASCLPPLSTSTPSFPYPPQPDAPLPPSAPTPSVLAEAGYELWRELARRDFGMGVAVLGGWAVVEVVSGRARRISQGMQRCRRRSQGEGIKDSGEGTSESDDEENVGGRGVA